jgi:hypothetical protein
MPFFVIVPIWLLLVLSGIVLLFLPRHRRVGSYAIIVSTSATVSSFLLSSGVLYLGPKIGSRLHTNWFGLAVIGTYLFAIGLGALMGGIAGFVLTRNMVAPRLPD